MSEGLVRVPYFGPETLLEGDLVSIADVELRGPAHVGITKIALTRDLVNPHNGQLLLSNRATERAPVTRSIEAALLLDGDSNIIGLPTQQILTMCPLPGANSKEAAQAFYKITYTVDRNVVMRTPQRTATISSIDLHWLDHNNGSVEKWTRVSTAKAYQLGLGRIGFPTSIDWQQSLDNIVLQAANPEFGAENLFHTPLIPA